MRRFAQRIGTAFSVFVVALTAFLVVPMSSASATIGDVSGAESCGEEYGGIVRARFYSNSNFAGHVFTVKGSGECSAGYDNRDISDTSMTQKNSEEDVASVRDYVKCDTALYAGSIFTIQMGGGPRRQSIPTMIAAAPVVPVPI